MVVVDESPIAEAGPDLKVCANTDVHFDGSASHDFDGVVNRFTWDFGDGDTGGGEKPVHVFRKPGNYRVLLTIEGDKAGQCDNTSTDEVSVQVAAAPVARIDGPSRIAVGAPAVRCQRVVGRHRRIAGYRWDFGDGSTAEGRVVEHAYDKPGVYVADLSVEPAPGPRHAAWPAQHRIVANAPPVAVAGPDRLVAVHEEVSFDGSGSSDPDGAVAALVVGLRRRVDRGGGDGGAAPLPRERRLQVTLTVTRRHRPAQHAAPTP